MKINTKMKHRFGITMDERNALAYINKHKE